MLINKFRTMVQSKLDSISGMTAGRPISDDVIEEEKYYFGYTVTTSTLANNLDYSNDVMTINITGHLSTKNGKLEKFDKFTDSIVDKLSELRIRATTSDVSTLDGIRKVMITGNVNLNTLDGQLR